MEPKKIDLDIHKIMTMLPHRYPILLVDRVLELIPHESIRALKNVTINEPYFVGHFPTRPVMPGVLILEALAQAAALLTFAEGDEPHDPATTLYYFVGIDGARFKRPVEPGDQLILDVKFERLRSGIYTFSAQATVDGVLAAKASLMCTVKHIEKPSVADVLPSLAANAATVADGGASTAAVDPSHDTSQGCAS